MISNAVHCNVYPHSSTSHTKIDARENFAIPVQSKPQQIQKQSEKTHTFSW